MSKDLPKRLPLMIGVTGHRDLRPQDIPQLERCVAGVFAELRCRYLGDSSETPLVVISALAEGADSLVARVALAQGAQLIAPLPMPVDEYRRDFTPGIAPDAAAEFDELLSRAIGAPIMPFAAGNSHETVRADEDRRAEQYRSVGIFIVQHCDVLIALWDGGVQETAVGGTTEIIRFRREGIPLAISRSARASLDGSEIGPVIHVVTPRNKAGSPATEISVQPWGGEHDKSRHGNVVGRYFSRVIEFLTLVVDNERKKSEPHTENNQWLAEWQSFETLIALNREFNDEAAALAATADGQRRTEQSIDYLFTDPDDGQLDRDARQRGLASASNWCRLYGIADSLAQIRQTQFKTDWLLLFVFGFLAFILFAFLIHYESIGSMLLGAYTVLIGAIYFIFIRARIARHQEKFLDYRALAEALRVAVYWAILSDPDPEAAAADKFNTYGSDMLADSYPIKQPNELAWVRTCLRTLEQFGANKIAVDAHLDPKVHTIARRYWVYGQFRYFSRQGARHSYRAKILEGCAFALFLITPLILVSLLLVAGIRYAYGLAPVQNKIIFVIVGILPALAAALAGYSERLAMKAQARQYDRMRSLFARAYEFLPETIEGSADLVWQLYHELGVEAMRENAEWVAIYRQRPIQPVQ